MRKLVLAIALLIFGGITFSAGTPARALEVGTLTGVTKAMPAGEVTKVRCRRYRRRSCYRRLRCYRPCYRRCYRRCYRPRYRRCYRPCFVGWAWHW